MELPLKFDIGIELPMDLDFDLLDRLQLGELLIKNYKKKRNVRPSLMEPQWVVDEALCPFRAPSDGLKFSCAVETVWNFTEEIHEPSNFICKAKIAQPMKKECTAAKSPMFYKTIGKYKSAVCFKVCNLFCK